MKAALEPQQYRRLKLAVDVQIRKYTRYRKQLHNIDAATYAAGMSCFGSEADLVQWLCEPALAIGWKVPLAVMGSAKGRLRVINILLAIDRGVYL